MSRGSFGVCLFAIATCCACASVDAAGDPNPAELMGGAGSSGTGGAALANGGSSSTGPGSIANGGTLTTGGVPPTGGSTGGTGMRADGGSPGMGGSPAVGGTSAGAPGSGGFTSGGGSGNGGTDAPGGAGGAAGAIGGAGNGGNADPCAGGMSGPASDAAGANTQVRGYGGVQLVTSTKTRITSLETTLAVPAKPTPGGTLFIWPGLEPLSGSANYNPIGTGVLQPVLTWGGTCAPHAPNNYADWWISGQYVNTLGNASGFTGCKGGDGMTVKVGDALHMLMTLNGAIWSQSVTDETNSKTVTFDFDLKGQGQNWVIFSIETPTGKEPVSDVVFTSTVITTADADTRACMPTLRGTSDYFSAPRTSQDGRSCCIDKIILRGQGVPASGPN